MSVNDAVKYTGSKIKELLEENDKLRQTLKKSIPISELEELMEHSLENCTINGWDKVASYDWLVARVQDLIDKGRGKNE